MRVWDLGATLYKLLTGQAPFPSSQYNTVVKVFQALALEEPAPLDELRSDIPAALTAVVQRMMAKRPEGRYSTPAEVALALAPFAQASNLAALAGTGSTADANSAGSIAISTASDLTASASDSTIEPTMDIGTADLSPESQMTGGKTLDISRLPQISPTSHPAAQAQPAGPWWQSRTGKRTLLALAGSLILLAGVTVVIKDKFGKPRHKPGLLKIRY